MHAKIELPKAFSVRDEHEFCPVQDLLTRMNPQLIVKEVATGVHVDGGSTVFWGLVYQNGKPPDKKQVETALREAGETTLRKAAASSLGEAGASALAASTTVG